LVSVYKKGFGTKFLFDNNIILLKFSTIGAGNQSKKAYSPEMTEAKKTVLFDKHAALAGKSQVVPFAGWMMPLWYQSISIEHTAVRKTAGLFDCTHMAVLKIAGKNARDFLNILTTNDVSMLKPGKAQYSYILNLAGDIIDDVIVYCIGPDATLRSSSVSYSSIKDESTPRSKGTTEDEALRSTSNFMVVANAANEQKVKDWLKKVSTESIQIDSNWQFEIKDLKEPSLPDARVDIALQGPASAECLKNIFGVETGKLKPFTFTQVKARDLDVIISATGYTGAKVSFELFVHPAKAPMLWDIVLEKGKSLGVVPCGLGARDSLRIEAGLPLYGHELDGEFDISPFQAGYSWAVKLGKKDFIGKKAIAKKSVDFDTEVARLKFDGSKGIRPIRQFDGIVNAGECIGHVLSCAKANNEQIALALIKKQYNIIGEQAGVYYLARNQGHVQQGRKEKVKAGDSLTADLVGRVVERFEKF
jgi:glycine hydroxymethyltransferase